MGDVAEAQFVQGISSFAADPDKINGVCLLLKAGKYTSATQYVSIAKSKQL